MERVEKLYAGVVPQAEPAEVRWRHASWHAMRERVHAAMVAAHIPAARINRFANCGAAARVEVDRDTGRARVRGFFCGDRFCVPCCSGRAAKCRIGLEEFCRSGRCWMLTFTLRHRDETLSQMLDRLVKHFASLRRLKYWRDRVEGGAWTVEIKRGAGDGRWHLHIHAVIRADQFSGDWLWRAWLKETDDSYQTKAVEITDPVKGAAYVAKYITKGWSADVTRSPEDLCECLRSLCGRRLLGTFGTRRPAGVDTEPAAPGNWKPAGRLVDLLHLAAAGDLWARGIVSQLRQHGKERERALTEPEVEAIARPPDRSPGADRVGARPGTERE